jgi:hypothetical protein
MIRIAGNKLKDKRRNELLIRSGSETELLGGVDVEVAESAFVDEFLSLAQFLFAFCGLSAGFGKLLAL